MLNGGHLLHIQNLKVAFAAGKKGKVHAVADVSFKLAEGETLGLVGESGCGKSSVARAIVQLPPPKSGNVLFRGEDLTRFSRKRLRLIRPQIQMIFQDSLSALNPRRKIGETIAMPLHITRTRPPAQRVSSVRKMMSAVGLDPEVRNRLPFQLSGGQCQRVQIARALMAEPRLLVCDEPVSSLDVSVQAQILNLLENLRTRYGLTMLFISHNMAVVKNVCDRVAVMYLGKLCETAPTEDLFRAPTHPYSAALINAIPSPNPAPAVVKVNLKSSEIPSPINPPSGCRFHTRCPNARALCSKTEPLLLDSAQGRQVACHYPLQIPPIPCTPLPAIV